jgi:nucleotide-binding universal stress UspA family protein
VLVVRERKRNGNVVPDLVRTNEELNIQKILVPVDFSECAIAGVMYAALLAKTFNAKLRLFHAVRPLVPMVVDRVTANMSSQDKISLANAREQMKALTTLDCLSEVKLETEIQSGRAVDEICAGTTEPDVDLLVISTHGHTGFDHALLGSVAEQVVRYADCPVMVVPSRCVSFK